MVTKICISRGGRRAGLCLPRVNLEIAREERDTRRRYNRNEFSSGPRSSSFAETRNSCFSHRDKNTNCEEHRFPSRPRFRRYILRAWSTLIDDAHTSVLWKYCLCRPVDQTRDRRRSLGLQTLLVGRFTDELRA